MLPASSPCCSPPGFEADPQHQFLFHLASEMCRDKHVMSSAPPSFPAYFPAFFPDPFMDFTEKREQREIVLSRFPLFDHAQRPGEEGGNQLKVVPVISCSHQGFALPPIVVPRQGQAPVTCPAASDDQCWPPRRSMQVFSWSLVLPSRLGYWGPALQTYVSPWLALKSSDLGKN